MVPWRQLGPQKFMCVSIASPFPAPPIWPSAGFHSEMFPHLGQAVLMTCVGYQAPRSVQDIITPPPPTSGPAWKGGSKPGVRRVEMPGQLAGAQFHLEQGGEEGRQGAER